MRQHSIVSAVLKMAADFGMAFMIGEFKELLDFYKGGSGFSFTDVAADLARIRFAMTLPAQTGDGGIPSRLLAMMKKGRPGFP